MDGVKRAMAEKVNMLGMRVDNITRTEALARVEEHIQKREPAYVIWVNLNQIILYNENARFKGIVDRASMVLTDGQIVKWLANLLHTPIKEKIGGTDFMFDVCRMAAEKGYKIFLLGGEPGAEKIAADNLRTDYPGLAVAGAYSPPYGFEKDSKEIEKINGILRESGADILFIGLGSPKQDYFMEENLALYNIPITFPTGSAIDMISGRVKVPPKWVCDIGMAWFYRFCQEPRRLFKRYFIDSWKIIGYLIKKRSYR